MRKNENEAFAGSNAGFKTYPYSSFEISIIDPFSLCFGETENTSQRQVDDFT